MAASSFANSVKVAVLSTGTGSISLGAAMTGYRGASALTNGALYSYHISDGANWENGQGVFTTSGATLTRATVYDSSNGGAAINMTASAIVVIGTVLAADLATTGTDEIVRKTSPSLVTPNIGAATGSSLVASSLLSSAYVCATGTPPAGLAGGRTELQFVSNIGYVLAYDRTALVYRDLVLGNDAVTIKADKSVILTSTITPTRAIVGNGSLSAPAIAFSSGTNGMGFKGDGGTQFSAVVNGVAIGGFYSGGFFVVGGMRLSPNDSNDYLICTNPGEFDVYANGQHAMRWTTTFIEARKPIDLQSGHIKFPATQISSGDPNTLDDYERGSWTPSITFGGAAVGVSYGGSNRGQYTKIGNRVLVNGTLQVTAKGSSVGQAVIGGLPFSFAQQPDAAPSFRYGNLTGVSGMQAYVTLTTMVLEQLGTAAITNANFGSGNDVISFCCHYPI